jgi:hypothetical protein
MTGVVLRCPNCGTVEATAGECEACHEAQVRYFCTNHTPGLWLDASSCAQCGARFGDVALAPTPAPSRIDRSVRTDVRPKTRPITPEPEAGPWETSPPDAEPPARAPSPWVEMLAAAARASAARRSERADYEDETPVRVRGGGCVRQLVLLTLFLFGLFVLAPLLLGGALLRLL